MTTTLTHQDLVARLGAVATAYDMSPEAMLDALETTPLTGPLGLIHDADADDEEMVWDIIDAETRASWIAALATTEAHVETGVREVRGRYLAYRIITPATNAADAEYVALTITSDEEAAIARLGTEIAMLTAEYGRHGWDIDPDIAHLAPTTD